MLNQLRVHYPKGCLISEFVTIDHGKYIVRSLVQVEGVTLATGMAAADTIEMAEDKARLRALAVLDISPITLPEEKDITLAAEGSLSLPPIPQPVFSDLVQPPSTPVFPEITKVEPAPLSFSEPKFLDTTLGNSSNAWDTDPIPFAGEFSAPERDRPQVNASEFDFPPVASPQPAFEPITSGFTKGSEATVESPVPSYAPVELHAIATEATPTEEPVDFSDIVARTNVELKRLGWTNQQGRDYLVKTYNKRSRQLLSDHELLEFLHYLEIQTNPND